MRPLEVFLAIIDSKLNFSDFSSIVADFFHFGVHLVNDYAPQEKGVPAT